MKRAAAPQPLGLERGGLLYAGKGRELNAPCPSLSKKSAEGQTFSCI